MDILYIIIPAYNESENLQQVVSDWYPVVERHDGGGASRLVIVDDGSTDGTPEILEKLKEGRPLLKVLRRVNGGHGPAVITGYRYALHRGADYIFQTDADGQTDAREFGRFWNLRERYGGVIGYRPVRGDGKSRKMVEEVLVRLLRLIFGIRVPDANAPFRLMKAGLLRTYLPRIPRDYNLPNVLLTTFFAYYREDIRFEAITFRPRVRGTASLNWSRMVKIGWKAVWDFLAIRRRM